MTTFRSLAVVLPAYNEEARIGPALDELFGYLDRRSEHARGGSPGAAHLPPRVHVLVVDDGSTDTTRQLVLARPEISRPLDEDGATLELLSVPHGGKGSAVRAGILAATSDLIIFADADMATPPDQLPRLVDALEDADVALGSRIQPDGRDMRGSQPLRRRLIGQLFHTLASLMVVGGIADTQCGFKGFRRDAGHDLARRQRLTGLVFDVELIHLARRRGYRIAVVPINWADRRGSRMHATPGMAIGIIVDLVRIRAVHGRTKKRPPVGAESTPGAERAREAEGAQEAEPAGERHT